MTTGRKDWEKYEDDIFDKLRKEFPGHSISKDARLPGRFSGIDRQIDILVRQDVLGEDITAIVDCKHFSDNVDVKDVEGFIGLVSDVNAELGILITNMGYSTAAINRAGEDRGIRTMVVDFQRLDEYRFAEMCLVCPAAHDGVPGNLWTKSFHSRDGWTDDPAQSIVRLMQCDVCASHHVECASCGTIMAVYDVEYDTELECEGECGLRFILHQQPTRNGLYEYSIELTHIP